MSEMTPSARTVARRFMARSGCLRVEGGQRSGYLDRVWGMYKKTYAKIGLHISNPQQMLKYHVWELCIGNDGDVIQFNLFKKTPFGLKSGLSGHDGSSEGKHLAVEGIRTKFRQPGYFGEVSHKVKDIAVSAGSPAVCAAYVDDIINKEIEPVGDDGLLYSRSLPVVGKVTKMMVGRPKGIKTTNAHSPSCPTGHPRDIRLATDTDDCDWCDVDSHYACMALDDLA